MADDDITLRLSTDYLRRQMLRMKPEVRATVNAFTCVVCGQRYARPEDRIERDGKFYHHACLWAAQRESSDGKK